MLILFLREREKFRGRPFYFQSPSKLPLPANKYPLPTRRGEREQSLIQLTNEQRRAIFLTSALLKEYQTGYLVFWAATKCKNFCVVNGSTQNLKIPLGIEPKYVRNV
jgi:hypothetical protein